MDIVLYFIIVIKYKGVIMNKDNIIYTILSVLALIVVIIGIVFAYQSWNTGKQNTKENNTLNTK